tara:strand:+ start:104896 stop:105309 length:414 start_codon:yes stop_codon:yes gene_type:complete
MEENKKIQLDAFVKKQIQEALLESPSKDFTKNLMNVLTQEETSKVTKYVPLISKKVWFALAAVFVAIFFIPFQKQEGGLLEKVSLDFSFFDKISSAGIFDGFSIPTTAFYGLLLFSVMVLAQAYYLKGYFSKRISGL